MISKLFYSFYEDILFTAEFFELFYLFFQIVLKSKFFF